MMRLGKSETQRGEVAARAKERVGGCGQYSWRWVIRLRRFMTAARISSQFRSRLRVRTMRCKSFDPFAGAICLGCVYRCLVKSRIFARRKDIDWNARARYCKTASTPRVGLVVCYKFEIALYRCSFLSSSRALSRVCAALYVCTGAFITVFLGKYLNCCVLFRNVLT